MGIVRTDMDNIVHVYHRTGTGREVQTIMIVEVKERMAAPRDAQRDTLVHFDQFLRNRYLNPHLSKHRRKQIFNGGFCKLYSTYAKRHISSRFYGVHLLQLGHTDPLNSTVIKWDKKPISLDILIDLLAMNLDPDTLTPIDLRKHHAKDKQATLFDKAA